MNNITEKAKALLKGQKCSNCKYWTQTSEYDYIIYGCKFGFNNYTLRFLYGKSGQALDKKEFDMEKNSWLENEINCCLHYREL